MPNINLLPSESVRRKGLGSIIFLLLIALIWVGACFWLYRNIQSEIAIADKEYSIKKEEIASLEKELTGLNEQLSSTAVEEEIVIVERKNGSVKKESLGVYPEIFPLLSGLSSAMPQGAWVTKVETKNGICLVEGYAFKTQDISDFLRNARGIDGVTKAKLIETKREVFPNRKIPLHHFQFELTLGGGVS